MAHRTCSIDGCDSPVKARGWCNTHYTRWSKYGDTSVIHSSGRKDAYRGTTCILDGCDKPRAGLHRHCRMHRARIERHGDPNVVLRIQGDDDARFAEKYVVSDAGCWIWTAEINVQGYGRFSDHDLHRTVLAHRWAFERYRYEIPAGLDIDHLCRERACVNPQHLQPVTNYVNFLRGQNPGARRARRLLAVTPAYR